MDVANLRHVRPMLTSNDLADGGLYEPESGANLSLKRALRTEHPYLEDICDSQLGPTISHADRPHAVSRPIVGVVLDGPQREVIWVAARRKTAPQMPYDEALWNPTTLKLPRDSVSHHWSNAVDGELTVATSHACAHPQPTTGVGFGNYLHPEPLDIGLSEGATTDDAWRIAHAKHLSLGSITTDVNGCEVSR